MDKLIYKVVDTTDLTTHYLELSGDQVRLLDWLSAEGYLDRDIVYEEANLPKIEKI